MQEELKEELSEHSGKIQASFSTVVKVILIFSIFYATYAHLWHILFANLFLLFLLFTPLLLRKKYKVHIPKEFEFIFLIFVVISFFLGDIRGIIIQAFFGIAVGFIGFTTMLILYSNSKFKHNYFLIILFSFSFSLAFGVIAELLKFYLKSYLGYTLTMGDYEFAIINLTLISGGAFLSSLFGYAYMKGYRPKIMLTMVSKFKKKNPNLFIEKAKSPEEVLNLIKKGENDKIEFKSTLRTNLYTNEQDKKLEVATLRSIVSFMNSEGGVLLIGISDKQEILGIKKDNFENDDRFSLHLTNLIKEKIGKEYLPYLNLQLVPLNEKNIMKIECQKSSKPVFLKHEGKEMFFTRAGASSVEISGSKLIDYINNNFKSN